MERQRGTHFNLASPPTIQLPAQPRPKPVHRRRRRPPNPRVMPWILRRQKSMLQQLPGRPHTHKYPRIPEFCQDGPCFFTSSRNVFTNRIKKSATNFRKPLEVGLKLAITLRHLATGDTYTSLQYHWLVDKAPSANWPCRSA